jgi:hypothetical protein
MRNVTLSWLPCFLRAGYVARGLSERVSQVDEQIKLRGGRPPK